MPFPRTPFQRSPNLSTLLNIVSMLNAFGSRPSLTSLHFRGAEITAPSTGLKSTSFCYTKEGNERTERNKIKRAIREQTGCILYIIFYKLRADLPIQARNDLWSEFDSILLFMGLGIAFSIVLSVARNKKTFPFKKEEGEGAEAWHFNIDASSILKSRNYPRCDCHCLYRFQDLNFLVVRRPASHLKRP